MSPRRVDPQSISDGMYKAAMAMVACSLTYDVYQWWKLRRMDREAWTIADNSTMGPIHDANGIGPGDIPTVSPVAGSEVAPTDVGDDAGSGD